KVVVTVLSRQGNGTPSAELLKTVEAALLNDNVRPLTDYVTVSPATVKPFEIRARLVTFNGPDSALVLAEARRRVTLFLQQTQRLGRDVPLSAL
ncbi:baseplate J/gp47 family protein, partial [Stenotrophomonas maltophilia]